MQKTYVTGGSGPLDVNILTGLHVVVLESGLDSESVGYLISLCAQWQEQVEAYHRRSLAGPG
jgi:hypothetical protein